MSSLTIGISAGSLVAALIIRLLLGRRWQPKIGVLWIIGAFLLVLIGAYLIWHTAARVQSGLSIHNWPTVEGTIVESKITGERAYAPTIIYDYTVDEVTYRDTTHVNVPMFGGKRKKHEVAEVTVADYPIGATVTVHYNEGNPAESFLRPSIPWNVYGQLSVGVTLLLAGLVGLMLRIKKGRKQL